MKYSIQFLKIKCSQTTRQVTRSDMKDSSKTQESYNARVASAAVSQQQRDREITREKLHIMNRE